ncbi:MAG: hypothetical protein KGZ25_12320, partial [Planctomycetes bacterium]|nr:hypothetical protein [Planctomycetota bacterium]
MKCKGVDVTGFEAAGDGKSDNADAFERAVSSLQRTRYGTIHVPDGVFEVSRPIRLGHSMSLNMAPSARILASQDFEGPAVVLKGEDGKPDDLGDDHSYHDYGGQICGGVIDAGGNEILGISIPWGCRYSIHDIEVHNARAGGIHLGEEGWYEATLRSVRIALDFDCPHMPGSVGLKIERVSDSHVSQVLVIGYETGVHATASSTGFHQVHVWNGPNRPLKCAFNAAGWHDMYSQCQADAYDGTAFYVNAPFQRFIGNFMQTHDRYSTPDELVGFEIGPAGTHCTYLGNFHNARENAPIPL